MISRVVAAGIVLFWLVMTGLLLRLEWFPGTSELLPVPVDHLFKLMFLHQEQSDLVIFHGDERVGDVHLMPQHIVAGPQGNPPAHNFLTVTGSLALDLPGIDFHRLGLRATVDLDAANTAHNFDVTVTLSPPKNPADSIVVMAGGEPSAGSFHYQVRHGAVVLAAQTGSPESLIDQPALTGLGLNPSALRALLQEQSAASKVIARRGVLQTKGEAIETYDVVIRQGDLVEATIQLSQLGQILAVQTSAGYSLLDQTLAP